MTRAHPDGERGRTPAILARTAFLNRATIAAWDVGPELAQRAARTAEGHRLR